MSDNSKKGPRDAAVFVRTLGDGDFNAELSAALHTLGNALQDASLDLNQKVKGSLSIKLKATCDERGVVQFGWDIKEDLPKKRRAIATLWVNKHGQFVHTNPKQQEMFPREVRSHEQEVREIDEEAQAAGREV